MYTIKCDNLTLHNPLKKDLILGDPTINLEVNKAGSLSFTIYPTHTYYDSISKMRSIISVYQDDRIMFKGRVYSDTVNFCKIKKVEVEGLLTYLNDSILRPYEFKGTPEEYLAFLINQHNAQVEDFQRFKLGVVTVTDANDYIVRANSACPNTWSEIDDKLIKLLGGYICIRYEADGNYIDYIEDYKDVSTQEIKFAINLQDLENEVKGDSLATCIIPYGARLSDSEDGIETVDDSTDNDARVTITSVNDGVDYIQDDKAVAIYGKIYEVVIWDDVTEPANLLRKARNYLSNTINLNNTLTIEAVDLHLADKTIESFKLGDYVKVYSRPHGIEEILLLTSYNVNLNDPTGCVFTLGKQSASFMDDQITADRENSDKFDRIDKIEKEVGEMDSTISKNTQEILNNVNSSIENSEETTRTMLKDYIKISEFEELKESVSTSFKQTADDFTFKFDSINERITTENGEVTKTVDEIKKYIRLVNGDIYLGEEGYALTTRISNGRISFLYNNSIEVAYLSENKLYITNAEILESIIIGNFAFSPRKNGNLSFKKVR